MAFRNIPYAAQTAPTMSELDQTFADAGALGIVPCTASGTNAITLTPNANTPTISAYANYQAFSFIAKATSTGAVTIGVSALAALNAYKDTAGGPIQLQSGDVINVNYYLAIYDLALNSGAGGFHVVAGASGAQQPTRQVLTSGSAATYTTPAGATRLFVREVGGGGGGAGSGTAPAGAGNGGNTTFSTFTAGGGGAGVNAGNSGAAGTATGGSLNVVGAVGQGGSDTANSFGGSGASAPVFGGAGAGGTITGPAAGNPGTTNTGGGGGGASSGGTVHSGGGGSSGGYVEGTITAPAATYVYTVGAAGTAGGAGTGGAAGTVGGTGLIVVDEFYN